MPTLLSYLGVADKMSKEPKSPGRDYSPVLRGENVAWEDVVFYEFENCRTIRTADWKYTIRRFPEGPDELYDLSNDPGETDNLVGKPEFATVQKRLAGRLDAFFAQYADPKYDLYRGGGSKSHLLTRRKPKPQ
jgi:arylsulfatase A-like enzyme